MRPVEPVSGVKVRVAAVAICAAFWLASIAACSNHYSRADADAQEAFVSYRGCASCASLTALSDNAVTLTAGR